MRKPAEKPSQLELLLVALTKQEFSLVWSCDFLRDSEEYGEFFGGIDAWGTPGFETRGDLWVERLRAAIRWLANECNWRFEWITVEDHSIRRTSELCEPGNAAYEAGLMLNQVHPHANLERALALTQPLNPHLARIFEDAKHSVEEAIAHRMKGVDPDVLAEWEAQNDAALQSVGVERLQKQPQGSTKWNRMMSTLRRWGTWLQENFSSK